MFSFPGANMGWPMKNQICRTWSIYVNSFLSTCAHMQLHTNTPFELDLAFYVFCISREDRTSHGYIRAHECEHARRHLSGSFRKTHKYEYALSICTLQQKFPLCICILAMLTLVSIVAVTTEVTSNPIAAKPAMVTLSLLTKEGNCCFSHIIVLVWCHSSSLPD